MTSEDIQFQFLERIKSILPPNASLAAELSDILDISMDSAYRRMRGDTPLSLQEAHTLAMHYKITLGGLTQESAGVVQFGYTPLYPQYESMESYLTVLLQNLRVISKIPEAKIFYCSQDIPIFHNISLNHLGQFKLYYWMRSIMNIEELLGTKYNPDNIPPQILSICEGIHNEYEKVSSAELWSTSTINSTLRQIQYYWESGVFENKEDVLLILADLRDLIHKIDSTASTGIKLGDNEAKYELYVSEIELTTNCALVEMGDQKAVFLGHHTFNMLKTSHAVYVEQTQQWFKNMIGKATLVSSVGEKYRFQFFQSVQKKISALEKLVHSED